jgi:hypothetical protein
MRTLQLVLVRVRVDPDERLRAVSVGSQAGLENSVDPEAARWYSQRFMPNTATTTHINTSAVIVIP